MCSKTLPKLRVSISDRCQLKCLFCGGQENRMENFQPDYIEKMLSTEKLLYIIKEYIKAGGTYVQFTGGEPLLRHDLDYLIEETFKYGGIPEINTNGIALTYDRALSLRDKGINVVKVSIPSFNKKDYMKITGVNALNKVLKNIETIRDVVDIRINMVCIRDSIQEIERAIDICNDLEIRELLLLELLYYPDLRDSKAYFESQFVNIKEELGEFIENKIGGIFTDFKFNNHFETKLYMAKGSLIDIQIYIKEANPVWRIEHCYQCSEFCQEGVYELRLSTGGYLSFCNICNKFGAELRDKDLDYIRNKFETYKKIINNVDVSYFYEFAKYHEFNI